jgi:hypothetical protein
MAAAMLLALAAPHLAQATTFHCGTGDVPCLIAAIHDANASGSPTNTIHLEAGTYTLTAVDNTTDGPNGLPSVTGALTMQGAGAETTIIARTAGASNFRLVHVAAPGQLTVEGLTLTGGLVWPNGSGGGVFNRGVLVLMQSMLAENAADAGGGLANVGGQVTLQRSMLLGNVTVHMGGGLYTQGGTVTITQSTLAENGADGGGALKNEGGVVTIADSAIVDNATMEGGAGGIGLLGGTLQVTNTTLARNRGVDYSGALTVYDGHASLLNCTVVENTTLHSGGAGVGGLLRIDGTLEVHNTIVAHNTGLYVGDCAGIITSAGHNLIGDPTGCTITLQPTDKTGEPGLAAFADDGRPGQGHYPLLATSQAIHAGDPQACPATDQLGQPRASVCDLGAVEFAPVPADVVALKQAVFADGSKTLLVSASSSMGPAAQLFMSVAGCLQDAPLRLAGSRYVAVQSVPTCGVLDGQVITVRSSLGGMAQGVVR